MVRRASSFALLRMRYLLKRSEMLSSVQLIDGEILLRPFRLDDATQLYCAVLESLKELKPWMSWATDGYTELTAREYITIARARWEERTLFAFAITRDQELV